MKLLKGVTVSILLFLLCFVAPFNIHADTISTNNIKGINTVLISKDQNVADTNSWYYLYEHTITLDADYVGTITLDVNLNYYTAGSGNTTATISNKQFFVNGNSIKINQVVTSDSYNNQGPIRSSSYLLKSSNVLKTSTITELQQIIDLLTDIYNSEDQVEGLLNNQLQQLQLVVQNTSLANEYLDVIKNAPYANFPMESLPAVMRYLNEFQISQGVYNIIDYQVIDRYQYPMFRVVNDAGNYEVFSGLCYAGQKYYFVFITKLSANPTNALTHFSVNSGFQIDEIDRLYTYGYQNPDNSSSMELSTFTCYKITASYNGSGSGGTCRLTTDIKPFFIIPIYHGNSDSGRSLEFALRWKLSNDFIDNVAIIANGTSQSNQQASDLSSGTDSMQQQMNSFTAQEDSYNQQMNNSINAIDFTSPVSQNAGILPAANFVISIFNGLIQNNAFSVLILIVCVLIIGKKVIGK